MSVLTTVLGFVLYAQALNVGLINADIASCGWPGTMGTHEPSPYDMPVHSSGR